MDRLDLRGQSSPGGLAEGAEERALWAQFSEATTAEAFCRSWLTLQCRIIEGVTGALVLLGPADRGPFTPAAVWPNPRRSMKPLTPAAERALTERRGLLSRREAGGPDGDRYDVAYPIEVGGQLHGVVVLEVVPRPEGELQEVLRQLHWGAAWLEVLFRREQQAHDAAEKDRLRTVLDLAATPATHERFFGGATAFVTALATRLDCDRVSLGVVRGGRVHIQAVSHSAHFGKETNLIRAIGAAMEEALDQQAVVVYPAPDEGEALVTRAHGELARLYGAGAICSIPLVDARRVSALLTLERPAERPFDRNTVELCQGVGALAGPLLELLRREDRWLVVKAAEAGRQAVARLTGPRHTALKLTVAVALALVAFFAFAKADYRVSAKTIVEPLVRRAVVAPFSGYVADSRVRAGDLVRASQELCRLDDRELRLERLKWLAQHQQVLRQYQQAMALRNAAQVRILAAQVDQAAAQLELLTDQMERTRVLAPFDGVVVTGDLSQALGSPVERGQVLFEVAPLEAFRLILQVDERNVADLQAGQHGRMVLASFPGEELPLTVDKLTPVSTPREGRNYFRVEARLDKAPERLRPGLEGVAKVEIDRRRVIWIWTHELVDWLRLTLWSWWP